MGPFSRYRGVCCICQWKIKGDNGYQCGGQIFIGMTEVFRKYLPLQLFNLRQINEDACGLNENFLYWRALLCQSEVGKAFPKKPKKLCKETLHNCTDAILSGPKTQNGGLQMISFSCRFVETTVAAQIHYSVCHGGCT